VEKNESGFETVSIKCSRHQFADDGDRGGPQNIGLSPFNYLMQVQAGGYFIEFSCCESFKLYI
jgi:hypothetical protein